MAKNELTCRNLLTIGFPAPYSADLEPKNFRGSRMDRFSYILALPAVRKNIAGSRRKKKMAVKVRLSRAGGKHRPFYRIVVADERAPRDGAFLELLGTYDPKVDPAEVTLKQERIDYWLSKGAKPSRTVSELLRRSAKNG